MTVFTESGVGLEIIQREVLVVLSEGLNDELDRQEELWETRDTEFANLLEKPTRNVRLEYIKLENMHDGHRPSLIMSGTPPEEYPNISVMAYSSGPLESPIDQATGFNINIDIELIVKAQEDTPLESAEVVDRRCHRTIEAIHNVLMRNPSLNGTILGFNNDPSINITDVFIRDSGTKDFEDYWWQLARIRYMVARNNDLPDVDQI